MDGIGVQLNIRRNMEEMQEAVKDLYSWEEDIKKKDAALKQKKAAPPAADALPPIRGSASSAQPKTSPKVSFTEAAAPTAHPAVSLASSHNTSASSATSPKPKVVVEEVKVDPKVEEENRKKSAAEKAKEEGNAFFKKGEYARAVDKYTECILLRPVESVFFSNRAMAYLKLSKFIEAELDCTSAIALDDKNIKAFHRRATARRTLGRLEEALRDFESALKLAPDNNEVRRELQACKEALGVGSKPETSASPAASSASASTAASKDPEQPKRKKMQIAEVEEDAPTTQGAAAPVEKSTQEEGKSATDSAKAADSPVAAASPTPMARKIEVKRSLPTEPPKTASEFERVVKAFKDDPTALASYVRLIEPSVYPQLFQHSFDADKLLTLLHCIADHYLPTDYELSFRILSVLPSVNRFGMIAMLIPKAEKETLRKVFADLEAAVAAAGRAAELQVSPLKTKYKM
jgi:tetratricopeptide (TPR) repeat protein